MARLDAYDLRMLQAVVLLHTTPDGGHHFDWMVEQPTPGIEHRLITWKCGRSPAEPGWDGRCERIAMHRSAYLEFEGRLSGNRGEVRRVASGVVLDQQICAGRANLTIRWAEHEIVYDGEIVPGGGNWVFSVSESV